MGWSIGYDWSWHRDIGYGVPAWCDHPDCDVKIDRGLSYVCGDAPYGGDHGCGLYFCGSHLHYAYTSDGMDDLLDEDGNALPHMCEHCVRNHQNPDADAGCFQPKPDHPEWIHHKLTDESWREWRDENPRQVEQLSFRGAVRRLETGPPFRGEDGGGGPAGIGS